MNERRAVRLYRSAMRLYPSHFRNEYGADMVLLFADQLRDEPSIRVWVRGATDLALTLPARHVEARMKRNADSALPFLIGAVAVAGLLMAIIGGTSLAMLLVGLGVAAVAGALAVAAWRHTQPIAAPSLVTGRWWKFLVAGATVLTTIIVVTTITGEVSEGMWIPMVLAGLCSLVMLAAGAVLGVVHLIGQRPSA